MKKKIFSLLIVLVLAFTLVACGSHSAASSWTSDANKHWHACSKSGCEEKFDEAEHTWDEGTVVKEATTSSAGEKTYTCTVCGAVKTETIDKIKTVSETLNSKNNDAVEVVGVIFGLTADGFYVSDGTAGLYVKLSAANLSMLSTFAVGDEVKVTGKFATSNNQPFVKNASAKKNASGKTALAAQAATLSTVNDLSATDKATYGKLFTIVAAVSKDEANRIVLTDATGSVILDDNCAEDYEAYVGAKVATSFVITGQGSGTDGWFIYAFKATATAYFVDINEVKDDIFNSITLPEEVYGSLELTTSYVSEPGVVFTWSVKSGSALEVKDNIVDVKLGLSADEAVTLELKLTSGETSATKEYQTTVKAISQVSLEAGKAEASYVDTKGLVVAAGIADETGEIEYIIVMDEDTKAFYTIDVETEDRKSVKVGDRIEFVAKYRSDKRPSYTDVQVIKVLASDVEIDYATLGATVLENTEDYQAAIDNNHEEIKLYKVVNPFMVGSGSSSYSWQQFGPTSSAAASGVVDNRQCCLLIKNFAENGLDDWQATYQVPTKNAGAKQYVGTVMYVFSVYQTGNTKWSFILPCNDACYYDVTEAVKVEINAAMAEEVVASQAGQYQLPISVTLENNVYALTWTSSNDAVISGTTGAYPQVFEETEVTLTASYTVKGQTYTYDYTVKVLAAEVQAVTVTEAIEATKLEGGQTMVVAKMEAYIAAIGASSENSDVYNYGIMLTDGVNVIYYITTDYTVGGVALKAYDKIEIKGATLAVDNDGQTLKDGKVTLISSDNKIDYSKLNVAATVSNNAELEAFTSTHNSTHGLVVKFTGDSIYFVGTGSKSANGRYQVNYKKASSSAASRYTYADGERSLVFSMQNTKLLLGKDWWEECGMPEKSGSKSYEVTGTFYAVGGYNGATLHAWTIINADGFDLSKISDEVLVGRQISANVEKSLSAKTASTYALPTKVVVNEKDYALTWTTTSDKFNTETGAYQAVSTDTKITLTASFTADGKACTYDVTIVLAATQASALTVTDVLANKANGDYVGLTGAIIAFIGDGNSATANYGFILMDNNTGKILAVHNVAASTKYGFVYYGTETALAIGDQVSLDGTYVVNAGAAPYVDMDASGKVTFVEKTQLNFHEGEATSAVVEVKSDAELNDIITSGDYYGKILKLVATSENPLHVSGSGTGTTTICNFKLGFHYGDGTSKNQIYYNKLTISTKSDINAYNTDGTQTFSRSLYGAEREDGKMGASANYERVGTLYITIAFKTTTYYQASIVNYANCSLAAK